MIQSPFIEAKKVDSSRKEEKKQERNKTKKLKKDEIDPMDPAAYSDIPRYLFLTFKNLNINILLRGKWSDGLEKE